MFTTYHLYVSPNLSTVQYRVERPLGSTRARTLRGMLLTKVWTLSRGICCPRFWTKTPSCLRFTAWGSNSSKTTANFVPNIFHWVHILTIGGPIHADDVLFMEVSIHYTSWGLALSSASSQLLRYHALPCGTKCSSKNSAINGSSNIWSRTHKEVLPVYMRDTTPYMNGAPQGVLHST